MWPGRGHKAASVASALIKVARAAQTESTCQTVLPQHAPSAHAVPGDIT